MKDNPDQDEFQGQVREYAAKYGVSEEHARRELRQEPWAAFEDPLLARLASGFTQVPNTVLRNPSFSPAAKSVYFTLLSFAWEDRTCYPGVQKLEACLGISRHTLGKYINELRDANLIHVQRRGQGRPNLYTFKEIPVVNPCSQQAVNPSAHKEYSEKNTPFKGDQSDQPSADRPVSADMQPAAAEPPARPAKEEKGEKEETPSGVVEYVTRLRRAFQSSGKVLRDHQANVAGKKFKLLIEGGEHELAGAVFEKMQYAATRPQSKRGPYFLHPDKALEWIFDEQEKGKRKKIKTDPAKSHQYRKEAHERYDLGGRIKWPAAQPDGIPRGEFHPSPRIEAEIDRRVDAGERRLDVLRELESRYRKHYATDTEREQLEGKNNG